MSDGRILAILNTGVVQGVQNANTATGNTGTPPGNLSQLLPGGVVRGEVIGRDSGGNPILRTAQGTDITIRTETFLKYGNQVVIRVDNTGAGARILSIDGQSPQNANPTIPLNPDSVVDEVLTGGPSGRGNAALNPSLAAAITSTPEEPLETLLIRSVLLSKAPSAPVVLSNLPAAASIPAETLQPGTQVFIRLNNAQLSQQVLPQNAVPQTPQTPGQQPAQDPASSPLQRLLAPQQLPAGQTLQQPAVNTTAAVVPNNSTPQNTQGLPQQTNAAPVSSNAQVQTQTTAPTAPQTTQVTQTSGAPTQPTISSAPQAPAAIAVQTPPSNQPQPQVPQQAYVVDQRAAPREVPQQAAVSAPVTTAATGPSSTVAATFLAYNASGDATFQTPLGIIKMPQGVLGGVRMAPGTPLLFEVAGFRPAAATSAPSVLASSGYTSIAGMADTLSDIFTIVQAANPQVGMELANRMPQTGPNFTGSTLFFIAAMTGGDAGKLLGQRVVNVLEQQGRGDLVRKLGSDFAVARSGLGEGGPSQNWQLYYIPLMHEQELHPVRMFVKKDKEKEEKNKKKKADTRFVIEVSLSALGDIQLDGFIKHKEKGMQFDLMLRTLQPLLPEDEQAIFAIYNSAAEIAGFTGSLNIQTMKHFTVKPMEEMLGSKEGSITA